MLRVWFGFWCAAHVAGAGGSTNKRKRINSGRGAGCRLVHPCCSALVATLFLGCARSSLSCLFEYDFGQLFRNRAFAVALFSRPIACAARGTPVVVVTTTSSASAAVAQLPAELEAVMRLCASSLPFLECAHDGAPSSFVAAWSHSIAFCSWIRRSMAARVAAAVWAIAERMASKASDSVL